MTDSLNGVLTTLEIPQASELLTPHWQESLACLPDGPPRFLTRASIMGICCYGRLGAEAASLLCETAETIRESPALLRLAWHCARLVYEHLDYGADGMRQWPDLDHVLPERSGLFYLLIALDMIPRTRERHRELGVPEEITRANCTNLCVHAERHKFAMGRWGTQQRLLYWLRNHTTGELFRLGRFQYMIKPFRGQLCAYRHRGTGAIVALANNGVTYSQEGWMLRGEHAWAASFHEDDECVTGNPVSPLGHAVPEQARLDKREWQLALRTGDPVIEMHIPAGGGMTPERCIESMRMATEFFPRYFPERSFKGFCCTSWVFNPRFSTILAPDANIRLFEQEVYLHPVPSGRRDGLYFIFGTDDVDPATAARDTSIRRIMLEEIEAGRPLMTGGMFVLTEDLEHFGERFYRRHCPFEESLT